MIRLDDVIEVLGRNHPSSDADLVRRAYVFSAAAHRGQTRRNGEPYLVHPLEVSYIVAELRLDTASVCAALLHDTVEDTVATVDDIKAQFGPDVAFLVDGVTKLEKLNFNSAEEAAAENFRKMLIAMSRDLRVILVKLADRLHNMRTLTHLAPEKQRRIAARRWTSSPRWPTGSASTGSRPSWKTSASSTCIPRNIGSSPSSSRRRGASASSTSSG
jgi:guanosine-3',5'-bis(diphosphate) 3'-pyrophosphohydrolase